MRKIPTHKGQESSQPGLSGPVNLCFERNRPRLAPLDETLAHEVTHQVVTTHWVAPDLSRRAVAAFGEKGPFDTLGLAGQSLTVSALLNTFAVPASAK